MTLGNIDEDVDYDQALAAGRTTAVALTAMSGVVIGNGAFYLIARQLLRRPAVAARPWVLYFLFWYIVHSVGNFYDYVPLRTFAANGDVKSFALGSDWSLWWIVGVAGYLTLWAIVDLHQKAMPWTLGATGFGRLWPARAIVLVLSTPVLFVLYALPALEQADPVSVFMGRVSLIIIPAVLIATWRRNVGPSRHGGSAGGLSSSGRRRRTRRRRPSTSSRRDDATRVAVAFLLSASPAVAGHAARLVDRHRSREQQEHHRGAQTSPGAGGLRTDAALRGRCPRHRAGGAATRRRARATRS